MGGYRGFFRGGKVLGGKVQSPESRVQGPVQLLGYACCSNIPRGLLRQYTIDRNVWYIAYKEIVQEAMQSKQKIKF